jgi:Rho-binding antiterminator
MSNITSTTAFEQYLEESIQQKKYVKLQYFTYIHEFITVMTIIKENQKNDHGNSISTSSGEEVPLENVVKIDGIYAPKYAHIDDISCDC